MDKDGGLLLGSPNAARVDKTIGEVADAEKRA